ncbi:MAG: hypothetical protein ACK41Y_13760 [Paracoccus hibiscisoli]|uniref:hypothetical protein n=1 Tax=Paracoccus hibiscisoli TaxID=2023261 RepID=UPI00391D0A62
MLDVARHPLPEGVTDDGTPLNRSQLAGAFGVSENTVAKWIGLAMSVENIIPEETHAFQFTATQTAHHLMIQFGAGVANAFNRFDNISVTPKD